MTITAATLPTASQRTAQFAQGLLDLAAELRATVVATVEQEQHGTARADDAIGPVLARRSLS